VIFPLLIGGFPPHSRVSTTLQPTRLDFPPDGLVRVAPHTSQEMIEVAREKIVDSLLQSRHATFRKLLVIFIHLSDRLIRTSLHAYMERSVLYRSRYSDIEYLLSW